MNLKSKKIFRGIAILILIISIGYIVNDQLRKLGNQISGDYLKELVSQESKGLYQLEFDNVDLNIFSQTISISNIELFATPKNREDSVNAKNIYEAGVSEVKISLESVLRIYTEKELVVDGIEVIDPLVYMTKVNPEKEPLKFGRETGELYDIISQYLDLLQINYLKVKSGAVNHSPSNFQLKAIDFAIENFTVSQKRKKKKIFYSEAINLGVNKQSILLPDSIHSLSFDGFELRTKDSILNFTNLKITPRKDIDSKEVFQKDNQNVYDIGIPALELKGINYLKAYEDNFLIVEEVNIPKPQIKIQSVLKSKKSNTKQAENSIGASLLALFDLIKIQKLKIQQGGLDLTLKGSNQQSFLSDNVSIELFKIELDSTQREIQNVLQYFENANIEINDYDYLLPDDLHEIKFKKLIFKTIDSALTVENLKIKPSRKMPDSSLTQFNLDLPLLQINGIAPREIYKDRKIDLRSLKLIDSEIKLTPPLLQKPEEQKAILTPEKLYNILNEYLTEITIDDFAIKNSNLFIGDFLSSEALNFQSAFLSIDSSLFSWHQIADSILFSGKEFTYDFGKGKLLAQNISSTRNLQTLDLGDLEVTFKNSADKIKVNYLNLRGIQLDSIINHKKLKVDTITLFQPNIDLKSNPFKNRKGNKSDWSFPESPISLLIKEGQLNYSFSDSKRMKLDDFDVDLSYQKGLRLFHINSNDFSFIDQKLNHQIKFKKLSLPKNEKNLLLKDIRISPIIKNDTLSLSSRIPEIKFININKEALIEEKNFSADSLIVEIQNISFKGNPNSGRSLDLSTKDTTTFSISIGKSSIKVAESNIEIQNKNKAVSQFTGKKTQLTLSELDYPLHQDKLLFAENFNLTNENLNFSSSNKDSVSLNKVVYNGTSEDFEIGTFNYKSADGNNAVEISDVEVKNADLQAYFKNKSIDISELKSSKTKIKLYLKDQEGQEVADQIKLPFQSLNLKQFLSNDINLKLYHEKKERNYYIRKADLLINNLSLDSTMNPLQIHQHLKSLVFSGKNYRENFGSHYSVTAKDYTFRYPEAEFEAHNIELRSKYDRFEYSQHIEYQNDWFKLDIATLELKKIDIDQLVSDQKFVLNKLTVKNSDFTVFRDLSVPLNQDKKVQMPQKILSELDFAFQVDTIFVSTAIDIQISPKETSGIGTMLIDIDSGQIFNMRTHHFKNEKPMILEAKGKLNEEANFQTKVEFPFDAKKSEFHFIGHIAAMDLTTLNEMLVPLGAIEVRSGHSEEVHINFKGNDDYAEGLMNLRYKNLKIDILDRETYQSKGFGNNLKTIFANSFVVSSKNPRWFKLQKGNIFFERIKNRSIFNFWAKSLLSGAVSSIGIKRSKEDAKAYYKENKTILDED